MIRSIFVSALLVFSCASHAGDASWAQWKARYYQADGRVVDDGNQNISHSEGQGYGMLLAEIHNDRATFDNLWKWTAEHLQRHDNALFSWRYDPSQHAVSDRNDATDGDMLIAWALLRAGTRWHEKAYLRSSEQIQGSLLKHAVTTQGGIRIMLPGVQGFQRAAEIDVNPSYFIFPAWDAFYRYSHNQQWQTLIDDELALLNKMRFGAEKLPADWVTVGADGSLSPAKAWPARFSYDAIRVPLYLNWYKAGLPQNDVYVHYWRQYPATATPAWVDISSHSAADYFMSPGMQSVRALAFGQAAQIPDMIEPQEDYYSASLKLLAQAAGKEAQKHSL